ncbi:hypothetical protein NPIL_219631 [Nephila pilipes]|uniref:Uncharacterized protein n=1 Tax=Nephila pilipes TaxID=299642 RepID=A0A8X6N2U1_NEPPI|nr:hypothetical protein NPIL_219631 [Nephila pilipes]
MTIGLDIWLTTHIKLFETHTAWSVPYKLIPLFPNSPITLISEPCPYLLFPERDKPRKFPVRLIKAQLKDLPCNPRPKRFRSPKTRGSPILEQEPLLVIPFTGGCRN